VFEERAGQADWRHQVGRDGRCDQLFIDGASDVVHLHDACVVDEDVQTRVSAKKLRRDRRDTRWIGYVELEGHHPGVGPHRVRQGLLPSASDDDLVAARVEGFGESSPDARVAASDEDRVAFQVHDDFSLFLSIKRSHRLKRLKPGTRRSQASATAFEEAALGFFW
jgi:hypothetical protein